MMAEDEQRVVFWFRLAAGMAAMLSVGFIAWAGVVWTGWQDVRALLFDLSAQVQTVSVRLEGIGERIAGNVRALERHEERPWHDTAGESLSRQHSDLLLLEQQIKRLQEQRDAK